MSSQSMTPPSGRVKRKYTRRAAKILGEANGEKPSLGLPDPLWAAQETARCASEGNLKLAKAVDALRETLETIVAAEYDRVTKLPVSATQLRQLAVAGLDRYTAVCGQNWRLARNKLTGATRAGDRDLTTLEA